MNWFIEKWDWWIYHRAFNSMRRMCERNGGFAYLLELWMRDWRERNPLSPSVERSTEVFFEAMKREREKMEGKRI